MPDRQAQTGHRAASRASSCSSVRRVRSIYGEPDGRLGGKAGPSTVHAGGGDVALSLQGRQARDRKVMGKGRAVRLTVSISVLKARLYQRLKLKRDETLSNFDFKSNLRRYTKVVEAVNAFMATDDFAGGPQIHATFASQFARAKYKIVMRAPNHQHWLKYIRAWVEQPAADATTSDDSAPAPAAAPAATATGGDGVAGAARQTPLAAAMRQTPFAVAMTAACPRCTSSMTCAQCAAIIY